MKQGSTYPRYDSFQQQPTDLKRLRRIKDKAILHAQPREHPAPSHETAEEFSRSLSDEEWKRRLEYKEQKWAARWERASERWESQAAALRHQISELTKLLAEQRKERAVAAEGPIELRKFKQLLADLDTENASLRTKLLQKEEQMERISSRLDELGQKHLADKEQLLQLETVLAEKTADLETLKRETNEHRCRLEEALAKAESERDQALKERQSMDAQLSEQVSNLKCEREALNTRIMALENELNQTKLIAKEMQDRYHALQGNHEELQKAHTQLLAKEEEWKQRKDEKRQKKEKQRQDEEAHKKKVEASKPAVPQQTPVSEEVMQLRRQVDRLTKQLNSERLEFAERQRGYERRIATAEAKLEAYKRLGQERELRC